MSGEQEKSAPAEGSQTTTLEPDSVLGMLDTSGENDDATREGDRDVFDRILADRNAAEPGEVEPEPKEAPKEETAEDKKEQGEAETPALSDEQKADYEAALRAMRRAKTPQSVIDGMSHEDAIAWGKELHGVQADADSAFSRVKDLERQLEEEASSSADGTSGPEDSEDSTEFEPVTLTAEDVTPLIRSLGVEDDDEAASELLGVFNTIAAAVDKVYQERNQPQVDPRIEGLQGTVQAIAMRLAREDLSVNYPEVKANEAKFQDVLGKFRTLWETGDYESHDDAMADAARLILGEPVTAAPPKQETAKPPKEDQPTVDTSRPPDVEKTDLEKQREVFDAIQARNRSRRAV